ncbi:hypothetical protein PRIPAC_72614 [Pristionchus pacificus]|uniref:Glycosyltransferase family 92 protein n=1 Tax=Pristionchus pacificus TaxID=54126 RepID=A0A2A6CS90_PRIPA|nr:hypothetical protein PRIPAC_72614 [Pristionchus pacificus]|eukprot:PDM81009.1 hypothetical protein PRIPAC_36012 [Pristionchus pacificus]
MFSSTLAFLFHFTLFYLMQSLQMVSHRLILALCFCTSFFVIYYFTYVDVHILPVIYIDRTAGDSIALIVPSEFKREVNEKEIEEIKSEEKVSEEKETEVETPEITRTTQAIKVPYTSIFIYRAYYDDRSSNGTVRVLLMSRCIKEQNFFQMRIGSEVQPMDQRPVEGSKCPWGWAPGCKWNAYALESFPLASRPKKVTIIVNGTREVDVDVNRVHKVKKGRMQKKKQICVPPLFWYTDWPRMVLFFEMWKKHNPTFIIYANSISSKVLQVLEHYQKQDLVQIVNWPLLPLGENGDDPNTSMYRLSHSLAHNDCVMRMRSEFGALVDIDEYLHLTNGQKLIDFAQEQLKIKENLASWSFTHHGLFIKPLDETFNGIDTANVLKMKGPPKTFFRPEKVKFLSTHFVGKFSEKVAHRSVRFHLVCLL